MRFPPWQLGLPPMSGDVTEVRIIYLLECGAHLADETVPMRETARAAIAASPSQSVPFGSYSATYECPRCGRSITVRSLSQIRAPADAETVELRIGVEPLGRTAVDPNVLRARREGLYQVTVSGQAAAAVTREGLFTLDTQAVSAADGRRSKVAPGAMDEIRARLEEPGAL